MILLNPIILPIIILVAILIIGIIGIKKLFAYLDKKTEYYKNKKD